MEGKKKEICLLTCKDESDKNLVQCEQCLRWFHIFCVERTIQEALEYDFICVRCDMELLSMEPGSSASETDTDDDEPIEPGYCIIAAIVGHMSCRGKMKYKVQWKGYPKSHDEWLPESEFKHAYRKLANYMGRNRLGSPDLPEPEPGSSNKSICKKST